MQMPGGRHDTSLDSLSLGDYRRPRSRLSVRSYQTLPKHRNTTDAGPSAAWPDVDLRQNYSPEDSRDAVEVDNANNTISYATLDHNRSRLNKFINAVGKPFARKRSKSADAIQRRYRPLGELSPPTSVSDQMNHSTHTSGSTSMVTLTQFANGQIPGMVGIRNHGNTCFMNAVIQCLSNTEFFAEYFVTNEYETTLLVAEKTGRTCAVTKQLSRLLLNLWTCNYNYQVSAAFRAVIGQSAVQYQGTEQNDAQEFLQWLLDCVNEELYGTGVMNNQALCTVKHKRKTENSVEEGSNAVNGLDAMEPAELGIIYDLFLAQFRSTLTCPVCRKQSCKLDPFLLVPLPISEKYKMPVFATVVYSRAMPQLLQVAALMSTCDMVSDLRSRIAIQSHIAAEQLVLVQMSDVSFTRTYNDSELMSELDSQMNDLYVIEVRQTDNDADIILIALNLAYSDTRVKRLGSPFAVNISRDVTNAELRATLLDCMQDMFKDSAYSQFEQISEMFNIWLVIPDHEDVYLPTDVDLPLYITAIDQALACCQPGDGPPHIKVVLEWDLASYKRWMSRSQVNVTPADDPSVKQVKAESQHLSAESLDECLDVFTQQERLGASDRWYCPTCRRYQTGTIKSLSLSSLPDVLVIQLKRFKQDTENRTKLNALIQFPLYGLDMGPRIEMPDSVNNNVSGSAAAAAADEFIYDLYAVCNHFGSLQGGHYTAYCKNPLNDQWYSFDDHRVSKMGQDAVVTKSAYLLFYRRRLAQTRCALSLQQWVSAACSASYGNRTPDTADRSKTPDTAVHNESVDAGSVVETTPNKHRTVEHRQRPSVRHMNGASSIPSSRMVMPRISSATQLSYQQAMLMQVSMRMHRNNPMLYSVPLTVRQPARIAPVPEDWITERNLRPKRLPVRVAPVPQDWITERNMRPKRLPVPRIDRDDSYIASSESEPDDASVNSKAQEARNEPARIAPVPEDWIPERNLRPKRLPVAKIDRDDSYITSAENEPDDASVNSKAQETRNDAITGRKLKPRRSTVTRVDRDDSYIASAESEADDTLANTTAQEALPCTDADTQEPLPAAAKRQSMAAAPVVTRQVQQNTNRRRRTTPSVGSKSALMNGADSSPSFSKNAESQLIDFAAPASVGKETNVNSVSNATVVRQRAPSRPSMIFEKVQVEMPEPVVGNRRHVIERRLPLHESSV